MIFECLKKFEILSSIFNKDAITNATEGENVDNFLCANFHYTLDNAITDCGKNQADCVDSSTIKNMFDA